MFSDVFRWFSGYRKFKVDNELRTSVADILVREGILFRSCKTKKNEFRFITFGKDVGLCEKALTLNEVPFTCGAYRGLVPAVRCFFRRPGLVVGAVIFFAINFISSHVVWNINVSGNEEMADNTVVEILDENGFSFGTFIPSVDFDVLHARIMAEHPEVAWISVNVSGTVAEVQMRETKFDGREKIEKGVFSNVTAAEDGRLVELRIDGGYPVKAIGDVVRKGQLLVSGVVPLRDGGTRFSYPAGEVLAEVERSVTVRAELLTDRKMYTGREYTDYSVKFFKKKVNLFSNGGKEYDSYDKIESEQRICLFGSVPLPVWIEKNRRTEYVRVRTERTYREALDEALSELRYETELLIGDGELLRKTTEISADSDGVSLTCRVLVLDNIAEIREFRVE